MSKTYSKTPKTGGSYKRTADGTVTRTDAQADQAAKSAATKPQLAPVKSADKPATDGK